MISLDDQFKYDFTEWDILLIVMYSFGLFLAVFITKLVKQALRDQEVEDALDFMVRQAEEHGLYEHDKEKYFLHKDKEKYFLNKEEYFSNIKEIDND